MLTLGRVTRQFMETKMIGHCIHVRSLDLIQKKSTKEDEEKSEFQWLWTKWRVASVDFRAAAEVVQEHDGEFVVLFV